MLSPLCESHSRHAATHERHPMQREGSRKMLFTVSSMAFLLTQYRIRFGICHRQFVTLFPRSNELCYIDILRPGGALCCTGGSDCAHFILRNLHHWLQYRVGKLVGGLGMPVVIRDEQRVWA